MQYSKCQKIDISDDIEEAQYDISNESKAQWSNVEKEYYEPILDPKNRKFTAPVNPKYTGVWANYKSQMASFWKVEEVDFSNDWTDFTSLNANEQHFIEMILAFFAASDGIVNFNLSERFIKDVQICEAIYAYQFQEMMENVHAEVYAKMLENLIKDLDKREYLFNAIKTVPSVKLMADWAFKWIESSKNYAARVVAFAVIEGIFFCGPFAAIFWLKKYKSQKDSTGKSKPFMDGLIKSNKWISRDESLHTKLACEMYKLLENKLSQTEINNIIMEGVEISKNFITDAIPVKLIGMNDTLMCDYIEYIADILSAMLGYKKIYGKKNPFKFMETIGLADKTNFFETRPTEYQDAHVMNVSNGTKNDVKINDDF